SGVVRGAAAPLTLVRIARLCRAGGEFSALPKTFPPVSVGKDREASFFDTLKGNGEPFPCLDISERIT
ncbi:MAG: hypothetical protein PUE14_10725, partial [Clostridia bacterium]|nr:hypothetical protein [Clostridia bacterium]